ncbi:ion channel [Lewinella sp. IMCC34183]|uniref:ion channel n=1 Tax=Lewinella sp. IMCC34183 TaxID=2248762 RepID=UPI000E2862BC|nr:transporter substrate-binding domain-containing protein [Lewinella sp. IMCC34183]
MLRILCLLLLSISPLAAQDVLRVGVVERPPYSIQDERGNWYGMAVQLWRHVAEVQQLRYEFREYPPEDTLLGRLRSGEIDVVLVAPLNAEEEEFVDFLQAYHRTALGVARPRSNGLKNTINGLFSLQFLYIVIGLSALLLLVGVIMYFLERGGNGEQFGGERTWYQGIGTGFWWAGVTMTTIGYGDKAPVTLAGRAVAMLWMLLALAVTSSLTAAIVSATNRSQPMQFPRDLRTRTVGVTLDSPAAAFLTSRGQAFQTFDSPRSGLRALADKEIEAFVDDETALRYVIDEYRSLSATIDRTNAEIEAYAFAVPQGSPLREPLDRTVIQITLTEMWRDIMTAYDAMRTDGRYK